ncbi:MAG: DUF5667 domain-containing protein, partial [Actinomycetota bacterium]
STFLFLTFSYTGTVFASANSIPGDILYNVKISAENIQTSLTPPSRQGSLHLRFLNRRMAEAVIILNNNINISDEKINNLLDSIDLEYKRCNEHNYLNGQQTETLNNEINGIKTETQMRMRKRDGTGRDGMGSNGMGNNSGGQCTSSTESTVSGNNTETTVSDNSTETSVSGYNTETTVSGNSSKTSVSGNTTESTVSGNSTETSVSDNSTESTVPGNSTKSDNSTDGTSSNDGKGFDYKNSGK